MSSCCTLDTNGTDIMGEISDCCSVAGSEERAQPTTRSQNCPICGVKGKGVDTETVKALLDISLHNIQPSGYAFCRIVGCPAVYFPLDGEQTLSETDLRVAVHIRNPQGSCCLGNVRLVAKRARLELEAGR